MSNWRFIVILGMILIGIGIVPVSADEIFNHVYEENVYETFLTQPGSLGDFANRNINSIFLPAGINEEKVPHIFAQISESHVSLYTSLKDSDGWNVSITDYVGTETYGTGYFGYFKYTAGGNNYLQIYLDIYELDTPTSQAYRLSAAPSGSIYPKTIVYTLYGGPASYAQFRGACSVIEMPNYAISFAGDIDSNHRACPSRSPQYNVYIDIWKNQLIINQNINRLDINIVKNFTGFNTYSDHIISFGETSYTYYNTNTNYSAYVFEDFYPVDVKIKSLMSGTWYNTTWGIDISPTPTPTPEPELTYPVTVNFRHKHDNSLITDVYYQIYDLKPTAQYPYGRILYSGWSGTGTINIELEHRSMDDPNFPQQYLLGGKKYGYYDGKVILSHLTAPYTFNVIMEDTSVTPTVDTALIEFRIQERFSDSYINDAILTIYDCESEAEVYNETVTGGIVKVRLNQTDTGYAYPHYRVNVYSEGYADFTEYILALYQDGIMRCRLTKVTTPLDPGNVILHVYTVRLDSNDNVVNVANVRVTVGGIEKVTNSAGYTWFEVPKNSTQMYTAEHPQYAVMSGSVLVEEGERFLHIWMQSPDIGVTPTPTVVTPTPTPDYSTPTGPIDAVYNLFSMLGIPTLFIGFILTALIAIGCMIFAESFAEGTGLYAGILGVLIGAGMGLIPLWIIIAFVFIGGIFYMKVIRGDG